MIAGLRYKAPEQVTRRTNVFWGPFLKLYQVAQHARRQFSTATSADLDRRNWFQANDTSAKETSGRSFSRLRVGLRDDMAATGPSTRRADKYSAVRNSRTRWQFNHFCRVIQLVVNNVTNMINNKVIGRHRVSKFSCRSTSKTAKRHPQLGFKGLPSDRTSAKSVPLMTAGMLWVQKYGICCTYRSYDAYKSRQTFAHFLANHMP